MMPYQSYEMLSLLAQVEAGTEELSAPAAIIPGIIQIAIAVLVIVALWKVFAKAGKPGWAAIVPIYNTIVMLQVAGRPVWWILLLLVPIVNIVILFIVMIDLAKNFGKGVGFGIGLALLTFIFLPILAFGDAQYQGSSSEPAVA